MITLILAIIMGVFVAAFALQNTQGVNVQFASYALAGIPLYAVMLASLLLGIILSWIISLGDTFSHSAAIRGRESKIRESEKAIHDLENHVHELEVENANLRGEKKEIIAEKETSYKPSGPSWWDRFKANLRGERYSY